MYKIVVWGQGNCTRKRTGQVYLKGQKRIHREICDTKSIELGEE